MIGCCNGTRRRMLHVFCSASIETRDQLFFRCTFTAAVWKPLTINLLGSIYTHEWQLILERILDKTLDSTRFFLTHYMFQTTLYTIWRERNCRGHGEPPQLASRLTLFIDKHIQNRISSFMRLPRGRYADAMEMWFFTRWPSGFFIIGSLNFKSETISEIEMHFI